MHALTHANAVCCVLCSAEAGSHSSRPHSSPTLIVQERQSFSHMAETGTLQALIGPNLKQMCANETSKSLKLTIKRAISNLFLVQLYTSLVLSVLLYAAETWTLNWVGGVS